jgi:hypothetical protein
MLVVDDVVLFPFKSLLKVFREIYNAAIQEQEHEGERIRFELGQLYLSLESGAIDEATFDERERELLDRLDELESRESEAEAEAESDEEDPSQEDEEAAEGDYTESGEDVGPYMYLPYSEQES